MIYFAVDKPRLKLLAHYLGGPWGTPLRDRLRQVSYSELFRARSLARGAWIFTCLDALSDAELQMVHHAQCAAKNAGLPVLNPAREALRRYDLLRSVHQSGGNDFQAHRAEGPLEALRFPVFVRIADEHDGSLTPLLHNRGQLRRAMAYLRMRGLRPPQLLVVEFCDTAGDDGLYRKYSIFRIGDTYVPRYLHIGKHWMMKENTRAVDPHLLLEERDYLTTNPHAAWVRRVFETAHIDYGRLDYGIRNDRPQAWEINFTPLLSGNPHRPEQTPEEQHIRSLTRPAKKIAHTALHEAFLRLDPGPIAGDDVRFEIPSLFEEQARRERRGIELLGERRQRIARIAAAPGFRSIGPLLRRVLPGTAASQ